MKIVYATALPMSQQSAGLTRISGVSQALALAGHSITIVTPDGRRRYTPSNHGAPGTTAALLAARAGSLPRALDAECEGADLLISYGNSGRFLHAVAGSARRYRLPQVADVVEWYDGRHLRGGAFGPRAIDNELTMRVRIPRMQGLILISSFLARNYRGRVPHMTTVPPLFDTQLMPLNELKGDGPLRFVYAGNAGKKDLLDPLIEAFKRVDPRGRHAQLRLISKAVPPSARAAAAGVGSVRLSGSMTRGEVLRVVANAHYVPLLRRRARFAEAGFPTKVAEAMCAGTAVFANHTSDLGAHVVDSATGIAVAGSDVRSACEALERAIDLGPKAANQFGRAARDHAVRHFDFRGQVTRLDELVGGVRDAWQA